MSGIVYIISAPSGSGKSTLVNEVMKAVPDLEFSISYTTRLPRGSERNGREYFFVPRQKFESMIQEGEFLEYANVFGDYYGTARSFLEDAKKRGKDLVLDIDVQGAAQVKQTLPEAVSTFILPPSREELEKRLRRRSQAEGNVEEAVIRKRLAAAAREIENYCKYDYVLVNNQLEQSVDQLKAIILSERIKRSGREISAGDRAKMDAAEQCLLHNVSKSVHDILASFVPAIQ